MKYLNWILKWFLSSKVSHLIRKISIGADYKNDAMHYSVGQEVYGGHTISHILLEDKEGSLVDNSGSRRAPDARNQSSESILGALKSLPRAPTGPPGTPK